MRKRLSEYQPGVTVTPEPGAFMPDGSYREGAGWAHQGPTHALVSSLVSKRRAGRLTPADAAAIVRNANATSAFPYIAQWEACESWLAVWAGTSAEAVVKYAGAGYKASVEDR